jgi:DNA-binding PadR family transcriptional regulator
MADQLKTKTTTKQRETLTEVEAHGRPRVSGNLETTLRSLLRRELIEIDELGDAGQTYRLTEAGRRAMPAERVSHGPSPGERCGLCDHDRHTGRKCGVCECGAPRR